MESQTTEWKETWHDEHMRTICAFANASGGVLEIGRRNDGEVVGVPNIAKLLEDLPNKIKNAMAIIADVDTRESGGKRYITIGVGAYSFPISYHGVYYIRSGSTTQELTGSALDEFILRKQGKTWDGVPVPNVTFDDFERDGFKAFRRKAIGSARLTVQDLEITDEVLLDNLMCAENNYLRRAAVLLFHQNPERWVLGAYIKIGLFENAANLIHQDEIHGPIITMADKVEELVYLKYFRGLISYRGIQRIETYPVPRAAFREAVLNAIVHRDYSTGNPVHIHIYPDKVLIYNDGRLPETWTVDDLFVPHTSKPYNPLIAGVFFRSGQIEAWGRGVEKITEACRYWDKPDPFYRIRPNEVMIGFHVDSGSIVGINGESVGVNRKSVGVNEKSVGVNGESVGVNAKSVGVNDKSVGVNGKSVGVNEKSVGINRKKVGINEEKVGINDSQRKVLELMLDNPKITAKAIAKKTGMTLRNAQIHIQILKKMGVIEHIGARKNGSWAVKLPK